MKILAIRGKNLASLAGEFEIDFQQQPLASAGLFAISGPTGAGKSTLLDTLCLALCDKTPRLQQAGSKGVQLRDVGDETLAPHDARNLLRRGCAEAYAEVDFVGNDRRHYRSRWSVRRARGRIDGKLQATEMELTLIEDQQRLGGKKTEVQEAVNQRLGLNFDQFTRAVLLAQNEFSVFLKAPDDERAGLLETLTGTDEYSRISIRAFDRAKLERQKLDELAARLTQQQPLAQAARQVLEDQKQSLEQNLSDAAQQKSTIDAHIQWHQRYQTLQAAEGEALALLEKSQAENQQAQVRRDYLAIVETVQEARPLLTERDKLASECQQSRLKMEQTEAALIEAQGEEQAAQTRQQQALQLLDQAEQQRLQAAADIAQTRALDVEINTLKPTHQQHRQALSIHRQRQQLLETELAEKQKAQHLATDSLAKIQDWLQQHAEQEQLSTQWPRWESLFAQAKTALIQLDDATSHQAIAEQTLQRCMNALQTAQAQQETIADAITKANKQYQQTVAAAGEFDAEALTNANSRHQQRLEQLRQADSLWQTLCRLQTDQRQHNQKLQRLTRQKQDQLALLATARQALPALVAGHQQAVKMLDLLRLTCSDSVEKLRANLQADSECPVCGSTHHPFAIGSHPFREQLATLEQEVAACLAQRQQAEQQENRAMLEIEHLGKQFADLQILLDSLDSEIRQQQASWQSLAVAIELGQCEASAVSTWLKEQLQHTETQQSAITQSLKAMTAANNLRDQARQTLDSVIAQQTGAQKRLETASSECREAEIRLGAASEKCQSLQAMLEQQQQELDAAFSQSDWRQTWRSAPDDYRQRCQQQASHWRDQQTQRQQLQSQLAILAAEIAGLLEQQQQSATNTGAAQTAFSAIDQTLSRKQQQRATLFAGRAVSEIEAELENSLTGAKKHLQATTTGMQQRAKLTGTCREAQAQALALLDKQQSLLADSEQGLSAWLDRINQSGHAEHPLDMPRLRRLLQYDNIWLTGERHALDTLKEALSRAQTILNERCRQCEQHLQLHSSLASQEELLQQLTELQAQISDLQHQHTELVLQLRSDDDRLKMSRDLLAAIGAQTQVAEIWGKLNLLIGSADGKKFRNIAQQLTLDILLGYANRHLKDLSRRYRLERVKDSLALQVVDQDMGDEIRSVHSLSGGESFLLSLALALGLASLSSNRIKVESLFIDEGFGSLDADTLRVAMETLDSLQALGRKVGVISHVQEMTERIGTRIQVGRIGGGLSKVMVCGV